MKKTIKLLAVFMIVAILSISLVSCTKVLYGSYSSTSDFLGLETTVTYTFNWDKVTITTVTGVGSFSNTTTQTGTYTIEKSPENPESEIIVFTFANEDGSTLTQIRSFSQGIENNTKYIKIDGAQYFVVK